MQQEEQIHDWKPYKDLPAPGLYREPTPHKCAQKFQSTPQPSIISKLN